MKKEIVPYEEIIKRIKKLGVENVNNKTGFGEDMIRSWIYNVYPPSDRQLATLRKKLFDGEWELL